MSNPEAPEFEKIVGLLLDSEITKDFPADKFRLFRDKRYRGKSGHSHQIDVSAELVIAGTKVIILVECKHYSRKVGIDDIMEFATRISDVGAHKGVVVTTRGFQKGAIKLAQSKGIALVVVCGLEWDIHLESPQFMFNRAKEFDRRGRALLDCVLPDETPPHLKELLLSPS